MRLAPVLICMVVITACSKDNADAEYNVSDTASYTVPVASSDSGMVIRFPLDSFPDLPANVRSQLHQLGCVVPQSYGETPNNIVRGRFAAQNQEDWAALCSSNDSSSIVVVWGGDVRCPGSIERMADATFMQDLGRGRLELSRLIGVASPQTIQRFANEFDGPRTPSLDHDGIEDAFIEKGSTILFCHEGAWVNLQGMD